MTEVLVAVGAVVRDEQDRLLLVRHRPQRGGYWQGKWICPGGRLELGETIEEGIHREVTEETGLEIELEQPLPAFDRVVKHGKRTLLHVVYVDYLARKTGGELCPGDDVGEAMWVRAGDVPAMWADLHEDTRRLLELGAYSLRRMAPTNIGRKQ